MTHTDGSKRFDRMSGTQPVQRPKIWVDGHQRPKFDLRAFGATSLGIAKRDLAPEILDAAGRLDGLGQRLLAGEMRVNLAWAGRAARFVPASERVGGWVLGLRHRLMGAHDLLVPPPTPDEPLAYAHLVKRPPAPAQTAPTPAPAPSSPRPVEPTLHAIRSVLQSSPHSAVDDPVTPRRPARATLGSPDTTTARGTSKAILALHRATSATMLGIMLGFALPAGAIKALLYHLDGGDLRDWS